MKCSKCHRDATKKIQLKGGFLPCCDSYDCNLLIRFDLIKPQINNAMKSIIVVLALLTINCNVANENKACTQEVITGEATRISERSLNISGKTVYIPKGVKIKIRFDSSSYAVINCDGVYTLDI